MKYRADFSLSWSAISLLKRHFSAILTTIHQFTKLSDYIGEDGTAHDYISLNHSFGFATKGNKMPAPRPDQMQSSRLLNLLKAAIAEVSLCTRISSCLISHPLQLDAAPVSASNTWRSWLAWDCQDRVLKKEARSIPPPSPPP